MARMTKAMLEAQLEVTRAALDDAMGQLKAAHRKLAQLEGACTIERDINTIDTRRGLLLRCKQLSAQGVPCHIRGNAVLHRVSGAVLAQIKE